MLPLFTGLVASVHAAPMTKRAVNPSLIPSLGFSAGVNPTGKPLKQPFISSTITNALCLSCFRVGTGDCDGAVDGANGQPIKVPCACPPTQDVFNQVNLLTFLRASVHHRAPFHPSIALFYYRFTLILHLHPASLHHHSRLNLTLISLPVHSTSKRT